MINLKNCRFEAKGFVK